VAAAKLGRLVLSEFWTQSCIPKHGVGKLEISSVHAL